MKQRIVILVSPLWRRLVAFRLPPAVVARLAPLRDRLAPIMANRALVSGVGLYALLFVVLLILFTIVRFPVEGLLAGGVAEANRRIAPLSIDYESATGSGFLGATLSDVTLARPQGRLFTAARVDVRPPLFASLFGRPGVDLRIDIAGGEADVAFRNHGYGQGAPISVSLSVDKIDTDAIDAIAHSPWAAVAGTLSGDGSITVDPADGTTLEGDVALFLRSLSVTLSKALFPDSPPIRIDEVALKLTAADKKIVVTAGSVKGPDLQAAITGEIALAKKIDFSRLNLTVDAQFSGDLKKRIAPFMAMIPGGAGGDGSALKLDLIGTLARPIVK